LTPDIVPSSSQVLLKHVAAIHEVVFQSSVELSGQLSVWICSVPTGIVQFLFSLGSDNSSMMTFSSRSKLSQGLKAPVGGCCELSSSKQQSVLKPCIQIPGLLVSTLYLTATLLIWSAASVRAQTSVDEGERFASIQSGIFPIRLSCDSFRSRSKVLGG
jgi:hypothetical protein